MSSVKILLSWKMKNKLVVREEMKVKIFLFVEKNMSGKGRQEIAIFFSTIQSQTIFTST